MKYIPTIVLFLCFQALVAQAISGSVKDLNTGKAIEGASVYFDGTSIGTITDEKGYFSIDPKFNTNAYLVVSYVGYKTVYIPHERHGQIISVGIEEEVFEIPEVILVSDPFSRKQKLDVFRKEFLGETKAAENSIILNEDAIELYFNSNTNTLSAYVNEPIVVFNSYLGYNVKFDVQVFKIIFKTKSLKRIENIDSTIFFGHTFFEDISEDEMKFLLRRKDAFIGSIQHFLRTLWNQNWLNESFEIRKNFKKMNISDAFTVSSGSNLFKKKVTFNLKHFKITHKKDIFKHWSSLKLLSGNTIIIDKYGSYMPYLQLKFGGYMASLRIGDLLPLDYEDNLLVD